MLTKYYCANGLISIGNKNSNVPAFWEDSLGNWRSSYYDFVGKIDTTCIPMYDAIKEALFTAEEFNSATNIVTNPFVFDAGMDPDSTCSKVEFDKTLSTDFPSKQLLFRALYWQDFCSLVSSIQSALSEIVSSTGEFYKLLAELDPETAPGPETDVVVRSACSQTRMATLLLYMTFVRMHSTLDFLVKLAHAVEEPMPTFSSYPKLKAVNVQFKHLKKLKLNGLSGSLFEKDCGLVKTIASIRNRVIHDGHLSPNQWIYERQRAGEVLERFVLFPDMLTNLGQFDKSGNRNSFYSQDIKINLLLPEFISEFFDRLIVTMNAIYEEVVARRRW